MFFLAVESLKTPSGAYKKAIELKKGKFPEAHYNLGQALRLNNQTREAEKEIYIAVQESATNE